MGFWWFSSNVSFGHAKFFAGPRKNFLITVSRRIEAYENRRMAILFDFGALGLAFNSKTLNPWRAWPRQALRRAFRWGGVAAPNLSVWDWTPGSRRVVIFFSRSCSLGLSCSVWDQHKAPVGEPTISRTWLVRAWGGLVVYES